jgi:predicted alpha/beta-hydrolase family hydrolase
MGGRIASHVAARGCDGVTGLIFLGYPLHPPGKPGQRRDAHLPAIKEPMLFVQGTRDAFGTADEIRALVSRLQNAALHEVPGGDHSFKVAARAVPDTDATLEFVLDAVRHWITRQLRA